VFAVGLLIEVPVPPLAVETGKDGICEVVASVPLVGNVTPVVPVIVSVATNAPTVANVEPSARVNVALVVGAVMATLFILVAVNVPSVGPFVNTIDPDPLTAWPNAVATPVPSTVAAMTLEDVLINIEFVAIDAGKLYPETVNAVPLDCKNVFTVGLLIEVPVPPSVVETGSKGICAVVASVPLVGNVTVVVPVIVKVEENAPTVANVEPSASVNVAPVAGAVSVTLFMLVAVNVPSVGPLVKTIEPDPLTAWPNAVATPVPSTVAAITLEETLMNIEFVAIEAGKV
jgi:hypothetical protein